MIYHSVGEIFASIDETRERLQQRLAGLNASQENFRAKAGDWSIAEIVEHLTIMEERLLRLMTMMVKKAESEGGQRAADSNFTPVSLEQFAERSQREKYIAPETVQPGGGIPVSDLLERMQQSRAGLSALRPRLEATDLSAAHYPHPAFGPLNLYEWLVMIGVHEARHLRQIEALMASPEFQSATARV